MSATLYSPTTASIYPFSTTRTGRFYRIVVVAVAHVVDNEVPISCEVSLEFTIMDEVSEAVIQSWVMFVA